MSLPAALPPGAMIGGHYIIGTVINRGGFGAVYRGVDTSEGNRPCAIKETYDVTPAARRRALMEASVLFTVRSPHLPEVYDAFEANGRFYLVMQLIEGQNLLQMLHNRVGTVPVGEQEPFRAQQGPCSEQEVLTWLLPIMEVLQDLHSRKPPILHRDIKPGNIILKPDSTTVLVDFGLTRLYDPNVETKTLGRAVTAGFSPLEQYVGKTTPQSDLYSLAATMYLLLTNRLPPAASSRVPNDGLLPPRQFNPALSSRIERALLKALSLHAAERYQDMQAFMQALREPAFTGFADQTVPLAPPQGSSAFAFPLPPSGPLGPFPTTTPTLPASPPARTYAALPPAVIDTGVYQPMQQAAGTQRQGGQQRMATQLAQPVPVAQGPLPGAFGQGCLWGLLQGILGAILVLALRQEPAFYVSTFIGYGFYILAGFMTTRKGGSSWRGVWAGYWAGITSTVMFWFVLGIGLLVLASRYLQGYQSGPRAGAFSGDFRRAFEAVVPQFPNYMLLPDQPGWVNLLLIFGSGLLLAASLGWYGGSLGRSRYKIRQAKRRVRQGSIR